MYQTVRVVFFIQNVDAFSTQLTDFLENENLNVLEWDEPKDATDNEIEQAIELGIISDDNPDM